MSKRTGILLLAIFLYIYLFVSAPPPLSENSRYAFGVANIPINSLLMELNAINAKARAVYTSKIVSNGKKAGLKFSEDWASKGVDAGPLPALFLRLTSTKLNERKSPIGLFLGSDSPINKSNFFKGEQVKQFEHLKEDSKPRFFEMKKLDLHLGMFADVASAQGCVSCHNKHENSPKKDWHLHDIMGATTWTYPRAFVTTAEAQAAIADLYVAIRGAYDDYLNKVSGFESRVEIGTQWPGPNRLALPDKKTFMDALFVATGPRAASFGFVDVVVMNKVKKTK